MEIVVYNQTIEMATSCMIDEKYFHFKGNVNVKTKKLLKLTSGFEIQFQGDCFQYTMYVIVEFNWVHGTLLKCIWFSSKDEWQMQMDKIRTRKFGIGVLRKSHIKSKLQSDL